MTQDEIIRMAREAGFSINDGIVMGGISDLKSFAAIVAADLFTYDQVKAHIQAAVISEREACAKVCDEVGGSIYVSGRSQGADFCAAAIRARNSHEKTN